jgi:histidyl-tRNA synthetase
MSSSESFQPVRGARDFYPEDMRQRNWLFAHFREVARTFGFQEVDVPVVEHAALLTRKAGEEILDQLFHFTLHDRHLSLRPEMTPSIVRMVAAKGGSLRLPLRWFAVGQNWRYERMMRGRRREHYQWEMDVFGCRGVEAEADLIAAAVTLMRRVGLADGTYEIRLNSRTLFEQWIDQSFLQGRKEIFPPLCVILDKLDKIGKDAVVDLLSDPAGMVKLDRAVAGTIVDTAQSADLDAFGKLIGADAPPLLEVRRLFDLLDALGVRSAVRFDAATIRGLSYYSGVVFEGFDKGGLDRAIFGGGRFDRLSGILGGPDIPAVGFGFGDVVITEILKDRGLLPEAGTPLDVYVAPLVEEGRTAALRLAARLRAAGSSAVVAFDILKPGKAIGEATQAGARVIAFLGPAELASNQVAVKDLATGQQRSVSAEDLSAFAARPPD